jgi:hypothetical protein
MVERLGESVEQVHGVPPSKGSGLRVKLTVVDDDFVPDSEMLKGTRDGWPTILANLKTLLETGETLPLPAG